MKAATSRPVPLPGRCEYVTATVAEQLIGIPIERVHDVFIVAGLTPVPLAPPDVAGLLNLRGRVITAIDLRRCFGLPPGRARDRTMAIGIEVRGESYGLIVDEIGEVLRLDPEDRAELPAHVGGRWAALSAAIHRLDGRLLLVLDVDTVLDLQPAAEAA